MGKTSVKVAIKKTSGGGKKPVKPTMGGGTTGGLLHRQILISVRAKKEKDKTRVVSKNKK